MNGLTPLKLWRLKSEPTPLHSIILLCKPKGKQIGKPTGSWRNLTLSCLYFLNFYLTPQLPQQSLWNSISFISTYGRGGKGREKRQEEEEGKQSFANRFSSLRRGYWRWLQSSVTQSDLLNFLSLQSIPLWMHLNIYNFPHSCYFFALSPLWHLLVDNPSPVIFLENFPSTISCPTSFPEFGCKCPIFIKLHLHISGRGGESDFRGRKKKKKILQLL